MNIKKGWKMKILVIGSGGREHSLCWAIAKSERCSELICAPSNAGIAKIARSADINIEDMDAIVKFSLLEKVDLVVVGPENPLVMGLSDKLSENGIRVFGPNMAAAKLEASKGHMKDFLKKYNIPTAQYARFSDPNAAKIYIIDKGAPIVIKTDGLAAGKGVIVATDIDMALNAVDNAMINGAFGDAGSEIIIEEFMDGEELSYFAICDGKVAMPFGSAQDHKTAFDGDKGPNTGGMGAYSPAPILTTAIEKSIIDDIINPTINGMINEGAPFKGVLFAGLMIADGKVKLIEYNIRFGDPECQTLMLRLKSDIVDILIAAVDGDLDKVTVDWHNNHAVNVVMAACGYPAAYEKDTVIKNIQMAENINGCTVFHAGTKLNNDDQLTAIGGRVLNICATGKNITQARDIAYSAVDKINWPDGFCRRDIAWRAIAREK